MIVRAAEPEDYPEICDMLDKAFKSKLERRIVNVTTGEDPNFRKGDLRIGKVDDKIVSMVMLIRKPLRIETAVVSGALVAPVATHPDYQRRGYCSEVMRDSIHYMQKQEVDLSILHGIPWLYPHYGYSPAMVKTELVLKPKHLKQIDGVAAESRPFTADDLQEVTSIYHNNTRNRTLAEIRSTVRWEWEPSGSEVLFEVFVDRNGQVVGYTVLGTDWGNRPCAHEIGVLNKDACQAVFNSLLKNAKAKKLAEYYCFVHPDHPFARFAFWRGGEMQIQARPSHMALIVNLTSLLTKMEKELERRLLQSELHDISCALRIESANESAILNISLGTVSVSNERGKGDYQVNIPLNHLNPLITGCKGIKELISNPDVKLKGGKQAARLMEILFPTGFPFGVSPPLVWE